MLKKRIFEEGYEEGWRLVMGDVAPIPDVPDDALISASSPYQQGFKRGLRDAAKKQAGSNYYTAAKTISHY